MFMDAETYNANRRQLVDGVRTLRGMPSRLVDVLTAAQRDFNALYRTQSELRADAWKSRMTRMVEDYAQRLTELQRESEDAFSRAEKPVNMLANAFPLPEDPTEQSVFLSRYAIASNRLTALLGGYGTDEDVARALRQMKDNGMFDRDPVLALCAWLDAGQIADARGWTVTTAVLWELEPLLPEPVRDAINWGRELGTGMHRVRTGVAQAFAYVRNTGRTVAVIPAWLPRDGVTRIDATSVQQSAELVP